MFKLPSKITLYIIVAIIVIGLLVFIYFMGRRSAKTKIEQVPLPIDTAGGVTITQADALKVREIAKALHDNMKGWFNFGFHDEKPFSDLSNLSDTLFVAVYNDFNTLYGGENDGTLREWITSERGWSSSWLTIASNIITRMDRLNLI